MRELTRFGKFTSCMKTIPLDNAVKHVLSFLRHVYMFLNTQDETLDINVKYKHRDSNYTVFATMLYSRSYLPGALPLTVTHRVVQPGSSGGNSARHSSSNVNQKVQNKCKTLETLNHF